MRKMLRRQDRSNNAITKEAKLSAMPCKATELTEPIPPDATAQGGVRVFRHTNSASKLANTWCFALGNVCHLYADEPNIPLEFSSYGKSPDEAAAEAEQYFNKLKKLIRKQTSAYKVEAAKSAQEEKEKLLERLKELEATP